MGIFTPKSFVPVGAKGRNICFGDGFVCSYSVEIFVLAMVLFVTGILTIALRCYVKIQQTP